MKEGRSYYMKNIINQENNLDDFGPLTEPMPEKCLYDFAKLREYCKKNNKYASELSREELDKFIITDASN